MGAGAYGGTPGRNALRPYGIWAVYLKIRMFFLPRIFESIRNYLHLMGFSTSPKGRISQNIRHSTQRSRHHTFHSKRFGVFAVS